MKAALSYKYCGPEGVTLGEIDTPQPAENEVLIKVRASSVNRTDCGFRAGSPYLARLIMGWPKPRFPVLGCEFAGDVAALGEGVSDYAIGDRVFGYAEDTHGFGGHAEFKTMTTKAMLAPMPDGFDYRACVVATEGAHYALSGIRACGLKAGDRIVINGGTGGIGSAAVQLCKHIGVDVTAPCRAQHFDTVSKLGASRVIDYETADFTMLLAGENFDAVLDLVGKSTFGACKPLLKPGGIYTSTELGPKAKNPFLALWSAGPGWGLGGYNVLFPIPQTLKRDIDYIQQLMESGAYTPLWDRSYKFEDIVEAYRYVETGQKVGNVGLEMP